MICIQVEVMENLIEQAETQDSDDEDEDSEEGDEVDPAEFGYLLCSKRGFTPAQLSPDNESIRDRIEELLSQRQ